MNNSHSITAYSSSTLLTKFICENPWMSLACSLVWLQPLTQSAAYTWMPILPLWRHALWIFYETSCNNWTKITLVIDVQKSHGSNTAHCTMSGPHHSHTGKPWSHSKTSWPRGPDWWVQAATWVFLSRGFANQRSLCKGSSFLTCGLSCLMWLWRLQKRLLILDIKESCQNPIKCLLLTSLRADRYKMIQNKHIELEDHPEVARAHTLLTSFDPMLARNVAHARPDAAEKAHETISASINAGKTLWLMILIHMHEWPQSSH